MKQMQIQPSYILRLGLSVSFLLFIINHQFWKAEEKILGL